jgi:hypothetical protein
MFNGYRNLLNATSNVVLHEWALDLNISLKSLTFQIAHTSIIMHFHCHKTSLYVHVTNVIFQQNINHVQKQCFEAIAKIIDEFERDFLPKA